MQPRELPEPEAGMVVRFQYQWADRKQPAKERPACIALVRQIPDPRINSEPDKTTQETLKEVVYLPISTRPPHADQVGIEIPAAICSILGFKDTSCWVVVSECNIQYWPNDINRVPGRDKEWHYGFVPPRFFNKIRDAFRQEVARRNASVQNVHYLPPRNHEA